MHFIVILCDGSTIVGKTYQHFLLLQICRQKQKAQAPSAWMKRICKHPCFFLFFLPLVFNYFEVWMLTGPLLTCTYGPNYSIVPLATGLEFPAGMWTFVSIPSLWKPLTGFVQVLLSSIVCIFCFHMLFIFIHSDWLLGFCWRKVSSTKIVCWILYLIRVNCLSFQDCFSCFLSFTKIRFLSVHH